MDIWHVIAFFSGLTAGIVYTQIVRVRYWIGPDEMLSLADAVCELDWSGRDPALVSRCHRILRAALGRHVGLIYDETELPCRPENPVVMEQQP